MIIVPLACLVLTTKGVNRPSRRDGRGKGRQKQRDIRNLFRVWCKRLRHGRQSIYLVEQGCFEPERRGTRKERNTKAKRKSGSEVTRTQKSFFCAFAFSVLYASYSHNSRRRAPAVLFCARADWCVSRLVVMLPCCCRHHLLASLYSHCELSENRGATSCSVYTRFPCIFLTSHDTRIAAIKNPQALLQVRWYQRRGL